MERMNMKKILTIVAALACAVACYPDYVGDYEVVAAGFANQSDVRSVVVGESMEFSTGVVLGGVINNEDDRKVSFSTDYSLVNKDLLASMKVHTFTYIQDLTKDMTTLKVMPASMYDLSTDGKPGEAVIKAGTHLGKITVKVDQASFLADEGNVKPQYIIPLRLTKASGCGLMKGRETTCIGVRYESLLFGSWWHGGVTEVRDASNNLVETIKYYTAVPQADTKVWTLTTTAPYSVSANAVGGELNGSKAQLSLTLNENGSVQVASVPGATYTVEPDGESSYNKAKLLQNRKVFLKYKYVKDGKTYHATDTLTFRNRVRDGVNEWQDENQNNY